MRKEDAKEIFHRSNFQTPEKNSAPSHDIPEVNVFVSGYQDNCDSIMLVPPIANSRVCAKDKDEEKKFANANLMKIYNCLNKRGNQTINEATEIISLICYTLPLLI